MATVPAEVTYTAGSVLTAAQLNTNLRDAVNFIITNRPILEVSQTASQSVPNGTNTALLFDAESFDNDGMHSTVSNTSRATAQTAGRYRVAGGCSYTGNVTGRRLLNWGVNGTVQNATDGSIPGSGFVTSPVARTLTIFLNVGDYVELRTFQDSGGALTTATSTSQQSSMSLLWEATA